MRYWGALSPASETPVNCHSELMEDPLQNVEPVQLGVKYVCVKQMLRTVVNPTLIPAGHRSHIEQLEKDDGQV